jgi:hypothetical protein
MRGARILDLLGIVKKKGQKRKKEALSHEGP